MSKTPKDEELEFISVGPGDDDNDMNTHYDVDPLDERSNNAIGHWIFNQSKHPSALFFHLLFKTLAILLYIFGSWVTSSFIFVFVICVILLAFDFWTVKNISGRLLVGLRWWSYVKEDGSNEWIFETLEDMAEISQFDSNVFWTALYVAPGVWALLLVVAVLRLKFEYVPIIIAAISMSAANIVGYMKCSNSAKRKVQAMLDGGKGGNAGGAGGVGGMLGGGGATLTNWALGTLLAITTNNNSSQQAGGNNVV
eukprot:gene27923-33720_t